MENKICPILSRPIKMHSIEGGEVTEVKWVDCQEKNCALWVNPPYDLEHCGLRRAILNREGD